MDPSLDVLQPLDHALDAHFLVVQGGALVKLALALFETLDGLSLQGGVVVFNHLKIIKVKKI